MKDLLHSSAWMKDEGRRTKDLLPSDLSFQSLYYLVFYPLSLSEQSERSFIFQRSVFLSCGVVIKHCQQTLLLQRFVFGVGIVGEGVDADAAAGGEDTRYLKVLRVHQFDQVFHDDVHAVFVEIAVIAERKEIELERFRLHHLLTRDIGNVDCGEVGLPRLGAERGELRTMESNQILVFRMFVYKSFEDFGSVVGRIRGVAVPQ